MRGLVLELACNGLLSERRGSDQIDPAWRKFTTELDHRRVVRKFDSTPAFEIPKDWRWVTLNELGTMFDVGSAMLEVRCWMFGVCVHSFAAAVTDTPLQDASGIKNLRICHEFHRPASLREVIFRPQCLGQQLHHG